MAWESWPDLSCDKGQEAEDPCSFDRLSQCSLVFAAGSGPFGGNNFSGSVDKAPQHDDVLVIDQLPVVGTEMARFGNCGSGIVSLDHIFPNVNFLERNVFHFYFLFVFVNVDCWNLLRRRNLHFIRFLPGRNTCSRGRRCGSGH